MCSVVSTVIPTQDWYPTDTNQDRPSRATWPMSSKPLKMSPYCHQKDCSGCWTLGAERFQSLLPSFLSLAGRLDTIVYRFEFAQYHHFCTMSSPQLHQKVIQIESWVLPCNNCHLSIGEKDSEPRVGPNAGPNLVAAALRLSPSTIASNSLIKWIVFFLSVKWSKGL